MDSSERYARLERVMITPPGTIPPSDGDDIIKCIETSILFTEARRNHLIRKVAQVQEVWR